MFCRQKESGTPKHLLKKDRVLVSVIIPTFNAQSAIKEQLRKISSQTVRAEIIVIDSSSNDSTADIARSLCPNVVSIPKSDFDHGGTRTNAARLASGELLVFLSQDAMPANSHSLENLIRPFRENLRVGASYGRQLPRHNASCFASHLRLFNYPEKSCVRGVEEKKYYGIKTPFISNSFAAYRREALEKTGWFGKNLIMGEDVCAGARLLIAGYRIAYASGALVYHSHDYTPWQEFRRHFDIGVFHRSESWILDAFGKAAGEGRKYIVSELAYIIRHKKYRLIPEFFIRNGLKYTGYRLGWHYRRLPRRLRVAFSMHREWVISNLGSKVHGGSG